MGPNRLRLSAESASKEHPPSRRLDEVPVLLALFAIVLGAVALPQLLVPRPPGDDSPEAGFARDMIVHHTNAVRMAETVRDRTEDPAIRILAIEIVLTQQSEIGQMQGWLELWGLPANESELPMAWMGHPQEAGTMPGLAAPEELVRLRQASPEEADEQFLRLMAPHHQSAVAMAEAVRERSDQPEVVRLAQKTVLSQQKEIRNIQALLQRKGLPPVDEDELEDDLVLDEPASHSHIHLDEALRDTARLAPLPLAVLAAAWLGFDAVRRRRAWAGLAEPVAPSPVWKAAAVGGPDVIRRRRARVRLAAIHRRRARARLAAIHRRKWTRLAEPVSPPSVWKMAAVGGLAASAVLHVGLAPAHFEEVTAHGVFFSAAGVVAAIAAAAILAWPSRPAYLAGAGISLTLVVLWAVFRLVPPPGAEAAEEVDLAGLFTKATEVVAATACIVLWFRVRRIHRSKSEWRG